MKISTNIDYLKDFQLQLDIIKNYGFNPIGFSVLTCEDTFIFETEEEAKKAYHLLERDVNNKWIGKVDGWWYGKENFLTHVKEYEERFDIESTVYWL
jgi:hypothetical protein